MYKNKNEKKDQITLSEPRSIYTLGGRYSTTKQLLAMEKKKKKKSQTINPGKGSQLIIRCVRILRKTITLSPNS